MCVFCCFVVVSQINNNNCYTLCYCAKYGKNLDIYKQRAKVFCFADYNCFPFRLVILTRNEYVFV